MDAPHAGWHAGHEHPPGTLPHGHPHAPGDPSGRPRIAIVGAGHVGAVLGIAFARAGWPVTAVASRDPGRLAAFRAAVPAARAFGRAADVVEDADLLFLTVPDDAISTTAAGLRLYAGQAVVHTSGALGSEVLASALAAGSTAASFHPLVAFADVERALVDLRGATVALDGDDALVGLLAELAESIGCQPVRLPPGGKPAYHAAAVLAAGGFIGLLDAIAELGRGIGLDEAGALAIYGPLVRGALGNAEQLGIGVALTGPLVRGDVGTVRSHLDAIRRLAPGALELYVAAARREIAIAVERGALSDDRAALLRRTVDDASD